MSSRGRGGGNRRGGRSSKPMTRDVQVSKKLSWLLRHGAQSEGLELGKGGYINLQTAMNVSKIKSLKPTLQEIKEIVRDNEKQRFSLIYQPTPESEEQPGVEADDADPSHYLIRANQGHSIQVDDADLLTPLTFESGNLPGIVVHGTSKQVWPKIVQSGGLKKMGRNHVHFATGLPPQLRDSVAVEGKQEGDVSALPDQDAPQVLSGMRASSNLFVFLDMTKALESGIKFWLSANGVVLTEGNADGVVPVSVFKRVEERGGKVLVENGEVRAG